MPSSTELNLINFSPCIITTSVSCEIFKNKKHQHESTSHQLQTITNTTLYLQLATLLTTAINQVDLFRSLLLSTDTLNIVHITQEITPSCNPTQR